MTPKKYQSGETDITGRISKTGDKGVRAVLYEAAHIILTMPIKGGALKSWAARLAKRAGMQKAKVALARKLAVILHRMLADGATFDAAKAAWHERPSSFQRRLRARSRQHRFAPPMAVASGQCLPPLRAAPSRTQTGTEKRRSTGQRNCSQPAAARKEKHSTVFGQDRRLPSRSGVPAGTMDWVRPQCLQEGLGLKPGHPAVSKIGPALSSSSMPPATDTAQKKG